MPIIAHGGTRLYGELTCDILTAMKELFALILVVGALGLLLFVPIIMTMHGDGGSMDCLITLSGIPCIASGGILSHIQSAQNLLLATTQQPAYMLALMTLILSLFALSKISKIFVPVYVQTEYSPLRTRQESISLALRRIFSWQSRLQHSPTLS